MNEEQQRFFITTNGCPENRIDTKTLCKSLESKGFVYTSDISKSDIVFFNGCGLHTKKQNETLAIYNCLQESMKEGAKLILYGCIIKINEKLCNQYAYGINVGSDDYHKLNSLCNIEIAHPKEFANELIPSFKNRKFERAKFFNLFRINTPLDNNKQKTYHYLKIIPSLPLRILLSVFVIILKKLYRKLIGFSKINSFRTNSFCIKISSGCLNHCTFCGVKKSRGELKSRTKEQIMSEFLAGINKNYTEFSILGTDVGAYGKDINSTLADLLNTMINKSDNITLRLRNIQPRYLINQKEKLIPILKTKKIPYLESAFESGSDVILKKMKRGYNIDNYIQTITEIKKEVPDLDIRTQIIVGFPGETKTEFLKTKKILNKIAFNSVEIYPFQPIKGTEAEKMSEQINSIIKLTRIASLYILLIKKHIYLKN